MRKAAVSFLVIVMCMFMFAGCGGKKTIEDQISKTQLQSMVDDMRNTPLFSTTYKDAKIKVEGNHVTFEYYYKMTFEPAQAAAMKETLENSGLDGQVTSLEKSLNRDYGVSDAKVTYVFYSGDGSVVAKVGD